MKIVIFQGGLGNQIFQFIFYQYVKLNIDKDVYAVVREGNNHNGYEIDRYFEIDVRKSVLIDLLFSRLDRHRTMLRGIFQKIYIREFENINKKLGIIYEGYWQDKKYFANTLINFKELNLSNKNEIIKSKMLNSNSIALHIRRGDYLQPPHNKLFANVCTLEYYKKAIEICESHCNDVVYFVFSDDILWAKRNLKFENVYYIDWNVGNDSIFDMYLMSYAKMNIIANSTFSYWGAFLNQQSYLTIYPKKWFNDDCGVPVPDIFPNKWIGI